MSCLGSGECSLNINAGGAALTGWDKDEDYSGPSSSKVTTTPIITTGVASPAPQAVYQSQRIATGTLKYTITYKSAPLGNFKITLHFAELYFATAGKRVFNVSINGAEVLSKLDVEAVAGGEYHALAETFTGSTTTNTIVVEFTPVTNNPIINGLQIEWGNTVARNIYVAHKGPVFCDSNPSSVTSYTPTGSPTGLKITSGISAAQDVAVDANGKIYVTNSGNNTVTTYLPNGTATTPKISAGISTPFGVAVDSSGKIYVTNDGNGNPGSGSVTTYKPDGTKTTPTITGLSTPRGIAVDSSGKIYIADYGSNTVKTYLQSGAPTIPKITGLSLPSDVVVDAAGKIYVLNTVGDSGGMVSTYESNGTRTTPTITSGLDSPEGLAVDSKGKIYVSNQGNCTDTITTYLPSGVQTTPTITGVNFPSGIAVF